MKKVRFVKLLTVVGLLTSFSLQQSHASDVLLKSIKAGNGVSTSVASGLDEDETTSEEWSGKKPLPANLFRISGGVGCIVSDVNTPTNSDNWSLGYNMAAGFTHYWKIGIGAGATIDYNYTSLDDYTSVKLFYLAPTISYSKRTSKNWIWDVAFGMGLAHYTNAYKNEEESQAGFGLHTHAGIEYMLSDHVGIGVEGNYNLMIFSQDDNYNAHAKRYDLNGFKCLRLMAGLRFYF